MENNKPEKTTPENNTETIFTLDEFSMEGYDKHIRQARNACFIGAGLLLINAVVLFSKYPFDIEIFWLDYLLWTIYIGGFIACGLWTKQKPYFAIIGAIIILGLYIVINAIIEPSSIISGWLFKIGIAVTLYKGLQDAKQAQEMKEQFDKR
jgi:peptidoglycan/LPS O-acetylase OafA/YrhL